MPDARASLILTRPRAQAERFADACRSVLSPVPKIILSPVIEIAPRDLSIDLSEYSAVILTSENGARVLAELTDVKGFTAYCVGDRTASVAEIYGMRTTSAGGDANDLVNLVVGSSPAGPLLHLHGAETKGNIVQRLRALGMKVEAVCIYDQLPRNLTVEALKAFGEEHSVILPLFSPRTAALVSAQIPKTKGHLHVVAISEATRDGWMGQKPEKFTVAVRPDAPHILNEIAAIWSNLQS